MSRIITNNRPVWLAPVDLTDCLTALENLRSTLNDGFVVWTEEDEEFLQALIDTVYRREQ